VLVTGLIKALDLVRKSFAIANKKILDHAARNFKHRGIGCTAELVIFSNKNYALGHIGDSKTYCLRDGKTETTDTGSLFCSRADK
jgi:protein phosphatase